MNLDSFETTLCIAKDLSDRILNAGSDEEFYRGFTQSEVNLIETHLRIVHKKVNIAAYNYLEKGEIPSEEDRLYAMSYAILLEFVNGIMSDDLRSYVNYSKGEKISKMMATKILANQDYLEILIFNFINNWRAANSLFVPLGEKKAA